MLFFQFLKYKLLGRRIKVFWKVEDHVEVWVTHITVN